MKVLHRNANEWVDAQIGVIGDRPNRANKLKKFGIDRLTKRLLRSYTEVCGFFDPDITHGGPRPVSDAAYERK